MVRCPACDQRVPEGHVEGGVAQCPACAQVFDASMEAQPSPAAPRELPQPPRGATVHPIDEGIEVTLSWAHDMGWRRLGVQVLVSAVWVVCVAGFAMGLENGLVFLVIALAGVPLRLGWRLVNRTTVLVGKQGVIVTHGPLPLPLVEERVMPRHPDLQLFVVEDTHVAYTSNRYGPAKTLTVGHTYGLSALGPKGHEVLTAGWHEPDLLRFVEAVCEHQMGIQDEEVVGQYQGDGRGKLF